ncbi:MAG: hypothetical protein IH942_03510 [Acidobacteria bacterium]|nr:hypothetical protein [Acidobacteriota bacterium]
MELGEPDESGRQRSHPIPGDVYEITVDMAVVTMLAHKTAPDLDETSWDDFFRASPWL